MGIRLDLIINTEVDNSVVTENANPDQRDESRAYAPAVALTWGTVMGSLAPWARVGFRFPDREFEQGEDPVTGDEFELLARSGALLNLGGGARFTLNENSAFGGSLDFAALFGDYTNDPRADPSSVRAAGGMWGLDFNAYFLQTVGAGPLTLRFRPDLGVGFVSVSNNHSEVESADRIARNNYFNLNAGVRAAMRYQAEGSRFSWYTGIGLQLFSFTTASRGSTDAAPVRYSASTFDGMRWDGSRNTAGNTLGIGMTFAPAPGVVIGAGLNSLLDRFFVVDLENMELRGGDWFAEDRNNGVAQMASIFDGITFDLTVSVRLGGSNGNAPAAAPVQAGD